MRVFNTGAASFWTSMIGEQLRLLKVTNLQYHLAGPATRALVERIAREMLPKCRQTGRWPLIDVRAGMVNMVWRGRGEVTISLRGTRISYAPDPIRRSTTIGKIGRAHV